MLHGRRRVVHPASCRIPVEGSSGRHRGASMTDLVAGERVVDLAGWSRAARESPSDEALLHSPEPPAKRVPEALGCVDDTLRRVDGVLEQAMSEVADGWHRLLPPPLNVLDHDLPQWLAQLVGGQGKRIRPAM